LYGAEMNNHPLAPGQTEDQEVWKEAMRAAEDEGDAAAAAAAEKETAAEMEEFTRDIAPAGGASEEEKSKEDSEGNTEQTAPKEEEEDEVMKEVVRMAHLDDQSQDPMQTLDNALRPIERYAVRFIENYSGKIDKDALTAEMEAVYKVEQFNIEAIEEAEEERVRRYIFNHLIYERLENAFSRIDCTYLFCRRLILMRMKRQMRWLIGIRLQQIKHTPSKSGLLRKRRRVDLRQKLSG